MKAIIEKAINTTGRSCIDSEIKSEFFEILAFITNLNNRDSLKATLKENYNFFIYGFGGSHFWVKQTEFANEENLITVFFE